MLQSKLSWAALASRQKVWQILRIMANGILHWQLHFGFRNVFFTRSGDIPFLAKEDRSSEPRLASPWRASSRSKESVTFEDGSWPSTSSLCDPEDEEVSDSDSLSTV